MDKIEKCATLGHASRQSRTCARRFIFSHFRAVAATLGLALSLAPVQTAIATTWAHAYTTNIGNNGALPVFRAASDGGYFVMLTTDPSLLSAPAAASRGRKRALTACAPEPVAGSAVHRIRS